MNDKTHGERIASLETSVEGILKAVEKMASQIDRLVWVLAFFSGAGALGSVGKAIFEWMH